MLSIQWHSQHAPRIQLQPAGQLRSRSGAARWPRDCSLASSSCRLISMRRLPATSVVAMRMHFMQPVRRLSRLLQLPTVLCGPGSMTSMRGEGRCMLATACALSAC